MKKHGLESVLDVGCGSAYKLVTYLGEYERTGLELPDTVHVLRERYPDRDWGLSDFAVRHGLSADVVICADVIEHLVDPDELMLFLQGISFSYLVLSTPDRNLVYWPWQKGYWGPPETRPINGNGPSASSRATFRFTSTSLTTGSRILLSPHR